LTLISDRYGFRPLFYVERQGTFLFASELKALCVADPQARSLDELGLFEYFCYGAPVMGRTWLQGYSRLRPDTILTVDKGGPRAKSYWVYRYDEAARTLDQQTYFTNFATLLDRAVERCMRGSKRIGIFLSGGYDSRSVAASIRPHHLPIPAFTFGYPDSRDIRYATMLADRLGLDHHRITDKGPYLYPNCHAIVWRTEGLSSFALTTSIQHHAHIKQHMDVILLGFLAELSGSHTWPQILLARSRGAAMRAIFTRILGHGLRVGRRIFIARFFDRALEALRISFSDSFDNVQNDHPLNIADAWNLMYLQPGGTYHSASVDRHLFEIRAPHMDYDLVDYLLTIPPYARLEQRVYKKMIAFRFPTIRDIPCTNTDLPIDPAFGREYPAMVVRYLGRMAMTRARTLLHMGAPLGREPVSLADDFRAEPELLGKVLHPLLQAGAFPPEIFDNAGIERMAAEHYAGQRDHSFALSHLISFGLAARFFLHDDFTQVPADMYAP
jgi:asparagine synthase (glutamine-hydrolysing)